MEVFAGFAEHADYNAGRVIDEIEKEGKLDNTLIFYIWGDNGSSSEGLNGTISEQLAQNGIPTKISQHIEALNELGGLDVLGGPKTDNMYHAGMGLGGQHALQGHETDRRLFRRHTPANGGGVAEGYQGRCRRPRRSSITSSTSFRRFTNSEDHSAAGGEWLRAGSDRRREHGLRV